jgi:hypothetical protein
MFVAIEFVLPSIATELLAALLLIEFCGKAAVVFLDLRVAGVGAVGARGGSDAASSIGAVTVDVDLCARRLTLY